MASYRICILGNLDDRWNEWFYGAMIENLPNGQCILTTPPVDQATLYGILNRLRDLNLTLVSANSIVDKND